MPAQIPFHAEQSSSSKLLESGDIRYIPNFLSEAEEQQLLDRIYGAPKPKWHQLSNRRLQNWGGTVVGGSKPCLIAEALPKWLEKCIDKIMGLPGESFAPENRPNHVLINEYLAGQGIMPHTDGPAFFPLISTISLGSHTFLDFYDGNGDEVQQQPINRKKPLGSLLLERRSLVLIQGRAYQLLHGIEERGRDRLIGVGDVQEEDRDGAIPVGRVLNWHLLGEPRVPGQEMERDTRLSLTIRNVPNVSPLFLKNFPALPH